jgi:hypothetical protein
MARTDLVIYASQKDCLDAAMDTRDCPREVKILQGTKAGDLPVESPKRLGPVRADCRLASKFSGRLSDQRDDDRGRHFEVLLVMRENAIEIMGVLCSDPFLGEALGKTLFHETLFPFTGAIRLPYEPNPTCSATTATLRAVGAA